MVEGGNKNEQRKNVENKIPLWMKSTITASFFNQTKEEKIFKKKFVFVKIQTKPSGKVEQFYTLNRMRKFQ